MEVNSLQQPAASIEWLLPRTPGAAVWGVAGQTRSLHFAPNRWLLTEPMQEDISSIERAAGDSLVIVDVSGKWHRVSVDVVAGQRILRRGIDLTPTLCERSCAQVDLFDCPVILVRKAQEYELWVLSSYLNALSGQL